MKGDGGALFQAVHAENPSPLRQASQQLVLSRNEFKDGSKRPDALVAERKPTQGGLTAREGPGAPEHVLPQHVTAALNQFSTPRFVMAGLASGIDPHTDSHMHDTNYVQVGLLPKEKLEMMDHLGIRSSTSMPIPTSLLNLKAPGQPPQLFVNLPAIAAEMQHARHEDKKPAATHDHHDHGDHAHADHHCGPLEFYYVPQTIVAEVEAKRKGTPAEGQQGISLQDFINDPKLVDRIVAQSELYPDTSVNSHLAHAIKSSGLTEAERSRIDPMMTGLHLGDDRVAHKFLKELYVNKGVFTGIGEITLNKELVDNMFTGHGAQASARTDSDAGFKMNQRIEPLVKLIEMAGVVGAPVVLHCDVDSLRSQIADGMTAKQGKTPQAREPDNLQGMTRLLTDPRVKDTTVVWAHAGGLGRFIQQGEGHTEKLQSLLNKCPNLKLDISWSEVAKQLTEPRKMENWVNFLEKNSTRICFGSDTLAPKDPAQWNQTKAMYGELFTKLTPEAKENVLNHTYESTFVAARDKVRFFEEKVLTPEFHDTHLNNRSGQPVDVGVVKAALKAARN